MELQKKHNTTIIHVGHSLGGALAQLNANNKGQKAITFNAYGAANLDVVDKTKIAASRHNITNFRMGQDFVSAISPHLGRVVNLTTQEELQRLKGTATGKPFQSHFIENFNFVALSPKAEQLAIANKEILNRYQHDAASRVKKFTNGYNIIVQ